MRQTQVIPKPAQAEPINWKSLAPVAEWLAWLEAGTLGGIIPVSN